MIEQVFVMVPGGFQVRGGKCLNAAEAKGSHKGCVFSGGEAYAMGFPSDWYFTGTGGVKVDS